MVDYKRLFFSERGREVYSRIESTVNLYGMRERLFDGVLLGLSGGADSVLLLCFLLEFRRRTKNFNILAVHVNHNIRGDEAKRDEEFSRSLCEGLGVKFICESIDVPKIARVDKLGIEEAARNARYSKFQDIIRGSNQKLSIAVAHNATDNLETVLFNMMRGAGLKGVAGIAPVRDDIIRPLIELPKADICALLDEGGVPYVFDSTNSSTEYSRNYIRGEIVPRLVRLCDSPETAVSRLSRSLRVDNDYLDGVARAFIESGEITRESLSELHPAVFARVIRMLAAKVDCSVERTHIEKLRELLSKNDFEYDLPSGARFICEQGRCGIVKSADSSDNYFFEISFGRNVFPDYDAELFVTNDPLQEISSNVYKISIKATLSSAIIDGRLFLRPRRDGDTVFYGGHHHKIKKILCDLKVPRSLRDKIPVLCDSRGVLWVPGISSRDDGVRDGEVTLFLGIGLGDQLSQKRFYSLGEFRS